MAGFLTLKYFAMDVWLLDQLKQATSPGLSLDELQTRWQANPRHKGKLSRTTFSRHRKNIQNYFGINIVTTDYKHYSIANPEQLALDTLANELLASVQEFNFLDEYRDLGDAIQPQEIWEGTEYLHSIGDAIRHNYKLRVRYQKFFDDESYEAILHPYCLKACLGRWYLLAIKEGSSHPIQTFALDRTLSLHVLEEKYEVDKRIDVKNYFKDAFGIWVDTEKYPVRDISVDVPEYVAKYWNTLPLHHSQKQISKHNGKVTFKFHISPTPDFMGELRRWGIDTISE